MATIITTLRDYLCRPKPAQDEVIAAAMQQREQEVFAAVIAALHAHSPGGRWDWDGWEKEAIACVEVARAELVVARLIARLWLLRLGWRDHDRGRETRGQNCFNLPRKPRWLRWSQRLHSGGHLFEVGRIEFGRRVI